MENGKVAVAAAAATIISRQAASKVILIKTYGNVCEWVKHGETSW